jgi:leucyl-tRNA synthetase
MKTYNPQTIEPKWQQIWADTNVYRAVNGDTTRPKYYMLTEFPYPSGEGLHAGHAREYTLGDVMARYRRMRGYNVLFPMGYDAFGLPTENYAIKHHIKPQDATAKNVASFEKQQISLGLSFDWDRKFNTSDPDYYRWTQWLFLQFFEKGLAYQAELPINWCPKEKTGLANEEVVNGVHERCGTPVEKKLLKQWVLKITAYADRLIEGLKTVDYPPRIADQQVNWIGRSEGAEIDFHVGGEKITVYTTRPDTLAGATFLALAPEHAAVKKLTTNVQRKQVDEYVTAAQRETDLNREEDRPKTGVFTGAFAQNPVTRRPMPVYVADYVLAGYGTGAIMAVPAHDERDYEFVRAMNSQLGYEGLQTYVDTVTPPRDGQKFEERQAALAIVKHQDKYLVLELKAWKTPVHSFPMGGIDQGETPSEAAVRELIEETGYDHVARAIPIGSPYIAEFYHEFKQLNRRAFVSPVLVELSDLHQRDVSDQERKLHALHWLSADEVLAKHHGEGAKKLFSDILAGHITPPLEVIRVVESDSDLPYAGDGKLINSGQFDGLAGIEAKRAITKWLFDQGLGKGATKFRLHDWIFSRQHYWGEPIPIIHCPKCGPVAVPADQLPVKLPDVEHYEPTDTGESPLAAVTDWVNTKCPKCSGEAKRETDTMPNWAGSSWYWLRYMDPHNDKEFAAKDAMAYWGEVDMYLGGMEHTTLHLLYSRFWHQFFYDQKLVPTPEPYAARRGQGIVLAADGRKMSKSIGNVIDPTDVIARYGADAFRLYVMFMAPYDETTPWSDERLNGVSRFLHRTWVLAQKLMATSGQAVGTSEIGTGEFETLVDRATHKTLKKVHSDLEEMHFNTMVSTLMEYVNFLNDPKTLDQLTKDPYSQLARRTVLTLIQMLAPSAPHIAEELWQESKAKGSVHVSSWPEYDPNLIKDDLFTIVIQVNGKLRSEIEVAADTAEADLKSLAAADPKIVPHLKGHEIVKTIVVPRRLVNFVVR